MLSAAGRARAVAIAKDTDGVVRVDDRLAIGTAKHHETDADRTTAAKSDAGDAAHDTKTAAKHAGHDAKESTTHAAKKTSEATKDTAGTAGETVTDGWITTKVKSSFVGVDALDGSNIDVRHERPRRHALRHGPSAAARAEAVRIAHGVKGVTRVNDKLTIGEKK